MMGYMGKATKMHHDVQTGDWEKFLQHEYA